MDGRRQGLLARGSGSLVGDMRWTYKGRDMAGYAETEKLDRLAKGL